MGAGGQTVACTTNLGATVVWGQGPMGELGLGDKKSSAKPAFVDSLHESHILDLACGQGSMLYVVEDDKGLPVVDTQAVEAEFASVAKPQPL
jgi:alpha-tubulin suppressor-like RCC1 family protein